MILQIVWLVLAANLGVQGLFGIGEPHVENPKCAEECDCSEETFDTTALNLTYRPVILLHGLLSAASDLKQLSGQIQEMHPGTTVFNLNCFARLNSYTPLWQQIEKIGNEIIAIGNQFPDGINLLGHSQGGIISRAILEKFPNHNVHTFISLASPQAGQCGIFVMPCEFIYKFYYTSVGQAISLANNWNDPYHHKEYLKHNKYLPIINNEIKGNYSEDFKRGIVKLKRMILIGGPDDGVIKPWQSTHFGYWKISSDAIEEVRDREIYNTDAIGLKTLDEAGKLTIHAIPHMKHLDWLSNSTAMDLYILPHLD